MNKKYILLLIFVGLIGIAFYYFQVTNSKSNSYDSASKTITKVFQNNLKRFENPLTGEITESEIKPQFLDHKPLGVMINNAVPARPQAGLNKADVIYEIVAEGGITRFLAIYLSELPEKVGPIRSVREYYLVIVKELGDAMLMHIGYSPQAFSKIKDWNVLSLGLAGADFYRDKRGNPDVATEHTAFASGKDLYTFGEAIKFNSLTPFRSWKFNESLDLENLKKANYLQADFWYEGDYSAVFKYDNNTKEYIRYSGIIDSNPQILIDDLDKKEVRVKNVVFQFANEVPIPNDEKNRLDYELLGSGNALVFRNGIVINAKWKKENLNSRTIFFNNDGKEIEFNRGKIWISIVPSRNENQVKFKE